MSDDPTDPAGYRALGVDLPVDHRPRKRSACHGEALDEHGFCMLCTVPVATVAEELALDRAAADMAVRDDLAREVARRWSVAALSWGPPASTVREVYPELAADLDRLAAAYEEDR